MSSDKYLNSVYPLEYLEYSSSLYHKPIHFFTFTLELIFTFHCPKALSEHWDHTTLHLYMSLVTFHDIHYIHDRDSDDITCYMHVDMCHMETEPTICMTCHVQAVNMTSWSWCLIFTCDTDRGCRAVTARHTSHDVTADDEAAWHVTVWRRTRDWPPRSWAAGRWPPDTYAMFDVVVLNSEKAYFL